MVQFLLLVFYLLLLLMIVLKLVLCCKTEQLTLFYFNIESSRKVTKCSLNSSPMLSILSLAGLPQVGLQVFWAIQDPLQGWSIGLQN